MTAGPMGSNRFRLFFATAFALAIAVPAAEAQFATRGITPVPYNDNSPVTLGLDMNQQQPRINSTVSICFEASKAGFATLWNISTAGKVARIFPNQFSQIGPAAKIDGAKHYCAGTNDDPFRFRVDGPPGTEDLYLLWTTRPDLQPAGADYADAAALVADMQRVGGNNTSEWGSVKITYDIVPPDGPPPVVPPVPPGPGNDQTAPVPPNPQDGPKAWILTMGSNVKPLTKSNQDASQFAAEMMKKFNIPDDHVRYLPDFKKADFIAGMAWLTRVAQPQDYVFIFYSGHGGRDRYEGEPDGYIYYLLPYDVETAPHDPKSYLLAQQLAFQINRLQTKKVIVVTDACFSGGVYRGLEAEVLGARRKFYHLPSDVTGKELLAADATTTPRTRAVASSGRITPNGLLLAAARNDETAEELSAGSLFTLALVAAMEDGQGGTLMDVFDRASKLTATHSKPEQDPQADGDLDLGRSIVFKKTAQ
jgi:hypothetical protein